jgi:hypothetical protein
MSISNSALLTSHICAKDTKNSRTWWCLIAPIRPRIEMRIRNTPHARIPPIIGRFVTTAEALPYTATPIRMNATS